MAERQGHPVAAAFISLITLLVAVVVFVGADLLMNPQSFCGMLCDTNWWSTWGQAVIPAAVCLVFGLWVSWRVGTGHRGLRRRPTAPAAGVDGEGGGDG